MNGQPVIKKNTFAKASLGNGIGAYIIAVTPFSALGLLFAGMAVVFGVVALRKYNTEPQIGGKGLAISGIVLGGIYFLIFVFFIVFGFVSYF